MPWQASTTLPLPPAVAPTIVNIIVVDSGGGDNAARHHQQQVKYGYIERKLAKAIIKLNPSISNYR